MKLTLLNLDRLRFADEGGGSKHSKSYIGGSQEWYGGRWQRASGCGPVAASNLIWYIRHMQGGLPEFRELMHELFPMYNPRFRGVSSAGHFLSGIDKYGKAHNLHLKPRKLIIRAGKRRQRRPEPEVLRDFIISSLENDTPVAFLNRSNGGLDNLEHWHWVTIIAFDSENMLADVSDYGEVKMIDMSRWLRSTKLGGALVSVSQ